MPIKITDGLSAKELLHEEGIFTIDKGSALHQDIRPLRILILNLMPLKKPTELQLLRLLGDSPLQVEVDFCRTTSHESVHTDPSYLEQNYYTFDDIKDNYYDGLIITGAPVEQIPFEDVDYWPELTTYLDWSAAHAFSTLYFCWGAQAALYHYYGIEKRLLPEKLFGIFEYQLTQKGHPLLRGFDDRYFIPQSRHTAIDDIKVYNTPALDILSRSPENGINIIEQPCKLGVGELFRFFRIDFFERDFDIVFEAAVTDCFVNGFVGVFKLNVFTGHCHANGFIAVFQCIDNSLPFAQIGSARLRIHPFQNCFVNAFTVIIDRNFINRITCIVTGDNSVFIDIGEKSQLLLLFGFHRCRTAANQNLRLNSDFTHRFYRMLRRLGFDFAATDHRQQ